MTEKQLRITGQDLARRRGVDTISASPNSQCLVCGHPTGDCVSEDAATEVWAQAPPERDPFVFVHNDVWVNRPSPGAPSRPMTSLMFAGGTRRRLSEVLTVMAHGVDVQYSETTDHQPPAIEDKDLPAVLRAHDPTEPLPVVDEEPLLTGTATGEAPPVPAEFQGESVVPTEAEVRNEEPLADPAVETAVEAGAADEELADEDLPAALRPAAKKSTTRRKSA